MPGYNKNEDSESEDVSTRGGAICKQTPDLQQQRARDELQEKIEWRDRDIAALRDMVIGDKSLHAPMGDEFLLRFLRARKFDYDRAFKLLQNYYVNRVNNPDLYANFKPSALKHVFNDNMQMILPQRDSLGRKIFLFRAGKWDPNHCSTDDIFRANLMCLESIIHEEETQLNGIVAIVDMKDFGMYQARHVRPVYAKKVISLIQDCFPARFKGFHFVNNPAIFDLLFVVVKPFLNEKVRGRVFFHGTSFESLHQHISAEILPEELGGTQPPTDNTAFVKTLLARDQEFSNSVTNFGYDCTNTTEVLTTKTDLKWSYNCGELFQDTVCGEK